jgi:ribosomal protein S6
MQTYELTYIISPEMTSIEAESKAKEIETAIQKSEGIILKQLNPIAKTLSQQIKKHASGFFGVLEFQLEQDKVAELVTMVQKDQKIVRHMILVKKPVKIKKQRRSRKEAESVIAIKTEVSTTPAPEVKEETIVKEKVELKDIEQKLEEILGE